MRSVGLPVTETVVGRIRIPLQYGLIAEEVAKVYPNPGSI